MKNKYIDSLLNETRKMEALILKVQENQKVPFSFFKSSFSHLQEMSYLLHELEFVQIEDMKLQMEKLLQLLTESESKKEKMPPVATENKTTSVDEIEPQSNKEEEQAIDNSFEPATDKEEISEQHVTKQIEEETASLSNNHTHTIKEETEEQTISSLHNIVTKESPINHIVGSVKSFNDTQTSNPTVLDTKRSISLNDRFLFQRELFNNSREEMNKMLTHLHSLDNFEVAKSYLMDNTNWDFTDETVDKFMQMLKSDF